MVNAKIEVLPKQRAARHPGVDAADQRGNNLKDVTLPAGPVYLHHRRLRLWVKSTTLINDPGIASASSTATIATSAVFAISGLEHFDKAISAPEPDQPDACAPTQHRSVVYPGASCSPAYGVRYAANAGQFSFKRRGGRCE